MRTSWLSLATLIRILAFLLAIVLFGGGLRAVLFPKYTMTTQPGPTRELNVSDGDEGFVVPIELVTSKRSLVVGVLKILAGGALGICIAFQVRRRSRLASLAHSKGN